MSRLLSVLFLVVAACLGSPITSRILGGSDADIKDVPYMASVDFFGHYCGAVILSATWALTDAWCYLPPIEVTRFKIRAGSALMGNGTLHNVTQWVYHPQNDVFHGVYDFAMVHVDPPFEFGENVAAVGLPDQGQESPDGAVGVISGWGQADGSDDVKVNNLQSANITVLGDVECADHLGVDYADSKLCAQDPNGVAAHCWYDEGGPLVVDGTLFGIALWPSYCNDPQQVQLYARVASVRGWIDYTLTTTGSTTTTTTSQPD